MLNNLVKRRIGKTEFLSGKKTGAREYTVYIGTDALEAIKITDSEIESMGVVQYGHYIVTREDGVQFIVSGENVKSI